jgi:hypothetical protein
MKHQKWEYLSVRCQFKGLGATKEFYALAVDGDKLKVADNRVVNSLPELLEYAGEDGWELVCHAVETYHYMQFKRPRLEP